jgi:hypothetical protein
VVEVKLLPPDAEAGVEVSELVLEPLGAADSAPVLPVPPVPPVDGEVFPPLEGSEVVEPPPVLLLLVEPVLVLVLVLALLPEPEDDDDDPPEEEEEEPPLEAGPVKISFWAPKIIGRTVS